MTTSLEDLTTGSGAPGHAGLSLSQKSDQTERSENVQSLTYGSTSDKTALETSDGSSHALAKLTVHNPADDSISTNRMLRDAGLTPTKPLASPSGLKAGMAKLAALKANRNSPKNLEVKGPVWDRSNCSITKADRMDGDLLFLGRLRDVFSGVFSDSSNLELSKFDLVLMTLGSYLDELRTNYATHDLAKEIVSAFEEIHNTWCRISYTKRLESETAASDDEGDNDLMSVPKTALRRESANQTSGPSFTDQPAADWSDSEDAAAAATPIPSVEEESKKESRAKSWLAPAAPTVTSAAVKVTRNKQIQRTTSVSATSSDSEITAESPTIADSSAKGADVTKCVTGPRIKFKSDAGQTVTCLPPKDFQTFAKAGRYAFIVCSQGDGWVELAEDFVPKNLDDIKTFAREQIKGYKRTGTLIMPTPQQVAVKEGKEVYSKFYTSNVTRFAYVLPTVQLSVSDTEGFTTVVSSDVATADTLKTLMSRLAKLETESALIPRLVADIEVCNATNTSLAEALEESIREKVLMQNKLDFLERKMQTLTQSLEDQGKSIGYFGSIANEVKDAMSLDGTLQDISDIAGVIESVASAVSDVDTKVETVSTNAASALSSVAQQQLMLEETNDAISLLLDTVTVIETTNQALTAKVDSMQSSLSTVATLSKSVASLTGKVGHLGNVLKDPITHSLSAVFPSGPKQTQPQISPPKALPPPISYASQVRVGTVPPTGVQVQQQQPILKTPAPVFAPKGRKPQDLATQQSSQPQRNPFLSSTVSEFLRRGKTEAARPLGSALPPAATESAVYGGRDSNTLSPSVVSVPLSPAVDLTPATPSQLASLQSLVAKRNKQLAQQGIV